MPCVMSAHETRGTPKKSRRETRSGHQPHTPLARGQQPATVEQLVPYGGGQRALVRMRLELGDERRGREAGGALVERTVFTLNNLLNREGGI